MMWSLFKNQLAREILICARQMRSLLSACLFLLMIVALFPLLLPYKAQLLQTIAPGIIWIAVIIAMFLSSEHLFAQEYDDGITEQWLVSGYPLTLIVLAKIGIFWLFNVFALFLLCPIIALLFSFNLYQFLLMLLSLLCGTPAIIFLCALAAAFSTSLKQSGILMALMVLPLTIPVMIFGSAVIAAAAFNIFAIAYLALLVAFSILAVALLPIAIAAVIRLTLN